jgi:hypothetical protein
MPEPGNEHRWLQRLVGDWTYEAEAPAHGDQPASRETGTEFVRSLGGLWVMGEMRGGGSDGNAGSESVITLGYDPARERFVGTFVSSMMTYLWIYEGELQGDTLTLHAEGPGFPDMSRMVRYRDVIELRGESERIMTSHHETEGGGWQSFMTMRYRRVL